MAETAEVAELRAALPGGLDLDEAATLHSSGGRIALLAALKRASPDSKLSERQALAGAVSRAIKSGAIVPQQLAPSGLLQAAEVGDEPVVRAAICAAGSSPWPMAQSVHVPYRKGLTKI